MADELSFDAAGTFKNSWNGKLLDIAVTRVTGPDSFKAFVYQCHLNEDIDGSATAYGWNNPAAKNSLGQPNLQKNLHPLENGPVKSPSQFVGLANAASPHQNLGKNHDFSWVGVYSATPQFATAHRLVIDDRDVLESRIPADGQAPILKGNRGYFPVVQQVGATAGYYVSQAMYLVNPGLDDWDQRKYADASVIPYAVWATLWHTLKVEKGNFGLAIRNATGAKIGFLFGDTGTPNRVGECSYKLVRTLSPTGYNEDLCSFIVFPGSGGPGLKGGPAHGFIETLVQTRIGKLQSAPNRNELIRFLALGADLNRFRAFREGKAVQSQAEMKQYANFLKALSDLGYRAPSAGPQPEPVPDPARPAGDFPGRTEISRMG